MRASYGETELIVGAQRVGSFRVLELRAAPALQATLDFTVGCRMVHTEADQVPSTGEVPGYELVDISGEVRFGQGGPLVGGLVWTGVRSHVRSTNHDNETPIPMRCVIGDAGLDRIEELRQGQTLRLDIALWPRVVRGGRSLLAKPSPFPVAIPIELWLPILETVREDRRELLEIRYPKVAAPEFRAALNELQQARRYVDRGDYPTTVTRCRKAMEMLAQSFRMHDRAAEGVEAMLSKIVGPDRAKLYASVLSSVKKVGNIELHQVGEHGLSRSEALFAIRVGEELVQLLGGLLLDDRDRPTLD